MVGSLCLSEVLLVVSLGDFDSPILVKGVLNSLADINVGTPRSINFQWSGIRELIGNTTSELDWLPLDSLCTIGVNNTFPGVLDLVTKLVVATSANRLFEAITSQPEETAGLWSIDSLAKSSGDLFSVVLERSSNVDFLGNF